MLQMAQDMFKVFQDHVRSTLHAMADLAESVGAPTPVTTFIQSLGKMAGSGVQEPTGDYTPPAPQPAPPPPSASVSTMPVSEPSGEPVRKVTKKRQAGARDLPDGIRALGVDDSINGSTYLARIIWSLGVADLEGNSSLRPADMARMIMARSPISLEPPNVARYIRRSKPTCIAVDHIEGSSNFYKLNAEGKTLFDDKFRSK
jgi:hypothetical protein